MEEYHMNSRVMKSACRALALVSIALAPLALVAQNSAKPVSRATADSASKWDIFVGYSYLSPNVASDGFDNFGNRAINYGAIGSVSRYFNKYVGVQFEGDFHNDYNEDRPNNTDFAGGSGGLILRYPTANFTPFVHARVGGESAGSYYYQNQWGVVVTGGGGLDYNTPLFRHHLAIRLFQADYQFNHQDVADFNMLRLSGGVVFHIGTFIPPAPVTLVVAVSPTSIYPGDPVTATATAGNLYPKSNVIYTWSGVAGITATGPTASVATATLAPGTYTVTAQVKEGRHGREGLKPWQTAQASANFTVQAFEPLAISCSASPSSINPGETSTITATSTNPQNHPLTYSYTSSVGTISGNGASAVFYSTGAPTGDAGITCNVSDDKGQTATSNTSVTIAPPALAQAAHSQALCSITFDNDPQRPARVDNKAKGCLDEVALSLQKQSDAKVVLVGEASAKERESRRHGENLAAERAKNTRAYLVNDKGIDASRINVTTGSKNEQQVDNYLVPAGASFNADVQGTTPVN
jgi:outer membrane protein OmpA-like peptidoglycan-associated protein